MNEEKMSQFVDCIINGSIPKQESFTPEEVLYIAKSVLVWSAEQINHTVEESITENVDSLVACANFASIKEAIIDIETTWAEEFLNLRDFIASHFD